MPKHYKEMMDEIINKMDESNQMGYVVKFQLHGTRVKLMLKRH